MLKAYFSSQSCCCWWFQLWVQVFCGAGNIRKRCSYMKFLCHSDHWVHKDIATRFFGSYVLASVDKLSSRESRGSITGLIWRAWRRLYHLAKHFSRGRGGCCHQGVPNPMMVVCLVSSDTEIKWLAVPLETTRLCSSIRNVRSSSPTQQPAFTCKVVLLYV